MTARELEAREIIEELADTIEAFYGRDIKDAYKRGDATGREKEAVLRANRFLTEETRS